MRTDTPPARAGRRVNPRLGADGHETDRHRLGRARRGVHSNVSKRVIRGLSPGRRARRIRQHSRPKRSDAVASIGGLPGFLVTARERRVGPRRWAGWHGTNHRRRARRGNTVCLHGHLQPKSHDTYSRENSEYSIQRCVMSQGPRGPRGTRCCRSGSRVGSGGGRPRARSRSHSTHEPPPLPTRLPLRQHRVPRGPRGPWLITHR